MNLKELAESLLKLDKDLQAIDAENLAEVVAALRMRHDRTTSIDMQLYIHDDGVTTEWKIWDGSAFHKGNTLAKAYEAWKNAKMTPEEISVDDVAGVLKPEFKKKLKDASEKNVSA